jgi:hypothetical protein
VPFPPFGQAKGAGAWGAAPPQTEFRTHWVLLTKFLFKNLKLRELQWFALLLFFANYNEKEKMKDHAFLSPFFLQIKT